MSTNEIIDNYVLIARKVINSCCETFQKFDNQIVTFLSLQNIDSYNSLIDSLYLLEDAQLAKDNYYKYDITGPTKNIDFGEIYLRLYGILNACYLQKQALINCCNLFNVNIDKLNMDALPIFEFRKIFAAHTTNIGYKEKKYSYILDRHSLKEGMIKGYTSNSPNGIIFKEANLGLLVSEWDNTLLAQLENVITYILSCKSTILGLDNYLAQLKIVFELAKDIAYGKCYCNNIWADKPVCVTIVQNKDKNQKSAPEGE